MSRTLARKALIVVAVTIAALLGFSARALGHAVLVASTPNSDEQLERPPASLSLTFSETVALLAGSNVDVVDERGATVAAAAAMVNPADAKVIDLPLKPDLAPGTYTARFNIVSADSHAITGQFVFGVGDDPLKAAIAPARRGPGETSPWTISARLVEFICLGGLLGVLAFRWLVWRTSLRRLTPGANATAATDWAARSFWSVFGAFALVTLWAEGYLLVTKSASALGQSVFETIRNPAGVEQVLADTRFGTWWQIRVVLLIAVFLIASWEFLVEPGGNRDAATMSAHDTTTKTGAERISANLGRPVPTFMLAAALITCVVSVSIQGHASTAPLNGVQVTADAIHLTAVSIWVAGIGLLAWSLYRLPRVAGDEGRVAAASVLGRFSQVATAAIIAVVVTGTIRSFGELSGISQLWGTGYGRSIAIKIGLLAPIIVLALRNRRVISALAGVPRPNNATLAMVRRTAALEFAVALVVVLVASVLVTQVPGRVQ